MWVNWFDSQLAAAGVFTSLTEAISFQCRIISPRISLALSRLVNSQASDISPPKTSL